MIKYLLSFLLLTSFVFSDNNISNIDTQTLLFEETMAEYAIEMHRENDCAPQTYMDKYYIFIEVVRINPIKTMFFSLISFSIFICIFIYFILRKRRSK